MATEASAPAHPSREPEAPRDARAENQRAAFVLEEYRGLLESMHRSEELGEHRVEFLITLVTAAAAGLIVLGTSDKHGFADPRLRAIVIATTAALLIMGTATFARMLHRDRKTDGFKARLARIRDHIEAGRTGLPDFDRPAKAEPRSPLRGGLATLTILLDSLLAGVATAALAAPRLDLLRGRVAVAGALAGAGILFGWKYLDEHREIPLPKPLEKE
jgi:hypothetical protein